MKLLDLNGNLVKVSVSQSDYPIKEESRSILQGKVGKHLQEKFPFDIILEDFTIPNSRLSLDFIIFSRSLAYEIDGSQHHHYNSFMHKNAGSFARQLRYDDDKTKWCKMNGIKLIRIVKEKDLEDAG